MDQFELERGEAVRRYEQGLMWHIDRIRDRAQKDMQPYVDALVRLQSMRPPQPIFLPMETIMTDLMRTEYRPLGEAETARVAAVKAAGQALVDAIEAGLLPSREASLAKTKAEEAVMWAVKGITG